MKPVIGRRPADQASDGRQAMWLAMKKTPDTIIVTELVKATRLNRSTVTRYLKALTEAGHLEHHEAPAGMPATWKLIKDTGHHAPRVRADGSKVTNGEITSQLWTAMIGLKDFDFRDLMQNASIEIPEATAKDYCKRLLSAGYLRVLRKADPALARIARYRLIRPSGPLAPQVQRIRQVYDPNTRTAYPVEGAL
ncbi:helix-turn-helix domain-containing protein [Pseudomonas sp. GX19020]|uniref:helix-turn-helix domain-containing protein n=1 Tax=Pseudomonas sp. GX19020 TaxID=2942277 RepID=UPI0020188109|nr:helix-turn-helix domain-containing protein [Pseudomonas sp. GX19020]MCL4065899.1 helix-turn-helix domain-containing protein [Pseudomonas sp. GX19020]